MTSKLYTYIQSERNRFLQDPENNIDHNNTFAFAFYSILRYYDYLQLSAKRYKETAERMDALAKERDAARAQRQSRTPCTTTLTAEEQELWKELALLDIPLHLDIESFYLFARILLDRIVVAIDRYFRFRGVEQSFHDWSKRVDEICQEHELQLPEGFSAETKAMYEVIATYRDHEITHDNRTTATAITIRDDEGRHRMVKGPAISSKPVTFEESDTPTELLNKVTDYLDHLVDFLRANRDKAKLREVVSE